MVRLPIAIAQRLELRAKASDCSLSETAGELIAAGLTATSTEDLAAEDAI